MSNKRKVMELNETFRHYDSLIWQVPSWGVAIAAGIIVAAHNVGKGKEIWEIPVVYVQFLILLFGALLLISLAMALYKYRIFQAASVPSPLPTPPFKQKPAGARYLQCTMCLMSGGMAGLAATQLFSICWPIVVGVVGGITGWIFAEIFIKRVIKKIDQPQGNAK